jgi:5-methylcytosine-specific restriction endonuclease McrA
MSYRYINAELRELVASRANFVCEYCLVSEEDLYFGCQVEHIISRKHSGRSEPENLAYACVFCNRYKADT